MAVLFLYYSIFNSVIFPGFLLEQLPWVVCPTVQQNPIAPLNMAKRVKVSDIFI